MDAVAASPGVGATGEAVPQSGRAPIPWLGIAAVLLGALIANTTTRVSSFGLADIRGAVHAGFDEGAWITTVNTTGQMLITPLAVWMASVYTPRRVLLVASLVFTAVSLVTPLSQGLGTLLALQFVSGLASGCLVPLTLSFILMRTPRALWSYGIALYALNVELSLSLPASLEGWYVDHLSWRWIYWQNVPLGAALAACLYVGLKPQPAHPPMRFDAFGLSSYAIGLALVYAGLDQGNRLDWLHSGLINGLLGGGVLLLGAFYLRARVNPHSWLDMRVALSHPLPVILVLITMLRLALLATGFLVPLYLGAVRGFRALQVGDAFLWVAVPQMLLCPLAGYMLTRVDARMTALLGLGVMGVSCLLIAYGLTPLWGSREFAFPQMLQALGQSLALTGVIYACVVHLRLETALSFGALLQTVRLFGGEVGQAFITTLQRVREQRASNLIGLHVQSGTQSVLERLGHYAHLGGAPGPARLHAAAQLLGRTVRIMATTQSVIDGFMIIAASVPVAMLLLAFLRPPSRNPG